MSGRRRTALSFALLLLALLPAAHAADVKLEREHDSDYADLILPSRVLGIGLHSLKPFQGQKKVNDGNAIKFDIILLGGGFENKLKGSQTVHGVKMPFFIEYAPHVPGKDRPGVLYTGPAGWKMMLFWNKMLDQWDQLKEAAGGDEAKVNIDAPAVRGQIGGFMSQEHNPPKEYSGGANLNDIAKQGVKSLNKKERQFVKKVLKVKNPNRLKASHLLNKNNIKKMAKRKKDIPNLLELTEKVYRMKHAGGGGVKLSKRDLSRMSDKGEHKVVPHGMGGMERERYWESVFTEATGYVRVYPSPAWVKSENTTGVEPVHLAVAMPGNDTYLTGYIRNCTVLEGRFAGTTVALLDDNLNGVYGEVGKDSVLVGEKNLTLFGRRLSIGKSLYAMEYVPGENVLRLTPVEEKPAYLRLSWNSGDGSELLLAIVKSGESYFSLINPPEDAPSGEEAAGELKHNPIAVPAGDYEIVGGLARGRRRGDDHYTYVSFTGGETWTMEPGGRRWVKLGEPLDAGFTFDVVGENRVFNMMYPKGASGEVYRWFTPPPTSARLVVKGLGSGFLGSGDRKLMRLVDDGRVFLQAEIKYNDVQYKPENGPFEAACEFDPGIFPRRVVKTQFPRIDKLPEPEPMEGEGEAESGATAE